MNLRARFLRYGSAYGVWLVTAAAGLAAAWAVQAHLARREDELARQNQIQMVGRVVAARDLPAGTRLSADMLALRDVALDYTPTGALDASEADLLLNTELRSAVAAGELVLRGMTETPAADSLSSQLAPGRRALTLAVHDFHALPRPLRVGDQLDLFVSIMHEARAFTLPLLSAGRVMAVAVNDADGALEALTLDAAPGEALRVIAAKQAGALTAVLRLPEDPVAQSDGPSDLGALLGLPARVEPPAPPVPVLYGDAEAPGMVGAMPPKTGVAGAPAMAEGDGEVAPLLPASRASSFSSLPTGGRRHGTPAP
ncbi:Flp pilus assembly protein CpaB [Bordetella genomosp. 5]|uniref:Flp pilus assembly protein CpaB n=1 Tax=Bordetella genomosp. 5 TaxID=1395608 RepID=UPI000B9DDB9B|nr:Flp pilus assembly protein CpaB [Bordetella genomosp. 5]OZI44547.1 Flp pilus assembly protein CpaB [Bordetella genomosp. 5]